MKPPGAAQPPPLPGGILRRGGGAQGGGARQVRFAVVEPGQDHEEQLGGEPAPLAAPVLNSSRLRGGEPGPGPGPEPFDAPRAAEALLGTSFAARCAVGGAAAGAMNVPPARRLYRGLVSLAVPPPMGPRRGALPQSAPHKVPGPAIGSPPGGEEEPWLPPLSPHFNPDPPRPLPRPPGAAFLMYRKLQQWGRG